MNGQDRSEAAVVAAFLGRYLGDRAKGAAASLEDYQARYPGFESAIAREYEQLQAPSDEPRTAEPSLREHCGEDFDSEISLAEAITLDELRRAGERMQRYTKSGELGRGGMGAVLSVWDRDLRRHLAMKVLFSGEERKGSSTAHADPRALSRFLEEAQVTAQLDHPGIVPIHELGLDSNGEVYFTMSLIRGRNLREIIEFVHREEKGWTLTRALGVLLRVCEAVAFAHSKGVIHRDLKPANVMVGRFGETYAMDWGLARVLGRPDHKDIRLRGESAAPMSSVRSVRRDLSESEPDSPLVTMDGDVVGTPAYMPPEQARGEVERVGPQADVYSIGAMLYHLLAGGMPYVAKDSKVSSRTVLARVLDGPPKSLQAIAPKLPLELVAICEKAMAREPETRYPDVMELAEDLRAYLEVRVVRAYETGPIAELRKWVKRNRKLALTSAAAVFALVAGFAVSLVQKERADETAARLKEELRANNIQRGRLFGRTTNIIAAENLLWREHLQNPESSQSLWALRELYSRQPCLATFKAHADMVWGTAFSPDGKLLVSAGEDSKIKFWDPASLRCIATLAGHSEGVYDLSFSPDGRTLASASLDKTIILWDVAARRKLRTLHGHQQGVCAVCFSPNGTRLASGSFDTTVRVWNAASGECIATLAGHRARITRVRFSPDGETIASSSYDATIRLWTQLSPPLCATLLGHEALVGSLAFTRDGRTLFSGSQDRLIKVWDVGTGECVDTLRAHNGTVRTLTISPDGHALISGGWWRIDLWDLATRTRRRSFPLHKGLLSAAWSPNARLIVSGHGLGSMCVWDASPSGGVMRLGGHSGRVAATISADGTTIASGDSMGQVRLWETSSGRLLKTLEGHQGRVKSLHFNPGALLLATGSMDGTLRVWDLATGSCVQSFEDHDDSALNSVQFSPDGRTLAHTCKGGTIKLRAVSTGDVRTVFPSTSHQVINVCFAPDGQMLASTAREYKVRLWSPSGEPIAELAAHASPWSVAFSSDGRRIASGKWDSMVYVWDAATRTPLARLEGHSGTVWSVAFRPGDPDTLASAAADGTVRLWDVPTGRCLSAFEAFEGDALSVVFSADGLTLVAAGADGAVLVRDLSYYDRHIAGNLRYQIERLRAEFGDSIDADRLTTWADEVRSRPWPRLHAAGGK